MKKGFQIFCLFFCMMLTCYSPGNSRQRIPKEMEWIKDDITYDHEDTIYHKTYYDGFVRGRTMTIRYPDINLKEGIEDYFLIEGIIVEALYPLADMFYDNRTIEMGEEELSFWSFWGTYWVLAPMELDIDTSHAHNTGDFYPDLDRDELFPATVYRDGIAYRPSVQNDLIGTRITYRLGKIEEVEKNRCFRLYGIYENIGRTYVDKGCYIEFTIK